MADLVKEISVGEFSQVINSDKLVVVDFYAEWCMPCLMMAPIIEALSEEHKDVTFAKINIDEATDLAQENEVSSIPTLIFFKDGQEIDRHIGGTSEDVLSEKINELK